MDRIKKLNAIQDKAVDALEKNDFVGTLKLATGVGKTISALKAVERMYNNGVLVKGNSITVLAEEVIARKRTFFEQEIPKYKQIFGFDILKYFNVNFSHYNTFAKSNDKPKLLILDEVLSIPI